MGKVSRTIIQYIQYYVDVFCTFYLFNPSLILKLISLFLICFAYLDFFFSLTLMCGRLRQRLGRAADCGARASARTAGAGPRSQETTIWVVAVAQPHQLHHILPIVLLMAVHDPLMAGQAAGKVLADLIKSEHLFATKMVYGCSLVIAL